jgi:four helix bundle suffix protein
MGMGNCQPEQKTKGTQRTKGRPGPLLSLKSLSSLKDGQPTSDTFIPPHGGYQQLLSYQKALVVYDATLHFCGRFIDKKSRTHDQMVQAALSGKQNILEGSEASATSKETEIKLTNVARASQKELLEDYRDFLRTYGLRLWDKNSREALFVRRLGTKPDVSYESYRTYIETRPPDVVANIIICVIHQTCYLLDQQLKRQEQDFLKEGGLRERMTRARLAVRAKQGSWP